jgi:hypothetical protein
MDKYSLDDLMPVKIPVAMPTVENWKDYVTISGQVQFQNNNYNYVKLRMTKDTLYLMCIPNYKKTNLTNQNIINARRIADIPNSKKDRIPFGKQNILNDYNLYAVKYNFSSPVTYVNKLIGSVNIGLVSCALSSPAPPPKC